MIDVFREALESMVYQFGYPTVKDGQPSLCTGGLSALEKAFEVLGWGDPHIIENPIWCDAVVEPRCALEVTCGAATTEGYKHLCSQHYLELVRTEGHSA